jgi:hypothetical protein
MGKITTVVRTKLDTTHAVAATAFSALAGVTAMGLIEAFRGTISGGDPVFLMASGAVEGVLVSNALLLALKSVIREETSTEEK